MTYIELMNEVTDFHKTIKHFFNNYNMVEMRLYRLFPLLISVALLVPLFGVTSCTPFFAGTKEMEASPLQTGLIRVALTQNVAPRSDWSNGVLYHLRILQKFIPIDITVITNFATLSDFQVLFLNMLSISDADVVAITDWVNGGGFLVCIGQSGRYTETGAERTFHPLAPVLGITLDGWERTSGAEVRKLIINIAWHWWGSGRVYDTANNGDGLYHELANIYYIPKYETVNVTLNGAKQKIGCRDKEDAYEAPFLTSSAYGSGKAFFIAADAFYRLVWKPPPGGTGLYDDENALTAGFWFRSGLLWQILYAIMLDCFPDTPLPIVTSMPNGFYTAMSFALKVVVADDDAYGNLTEYWKTLFDSYDELKGWFWGFWLMTEIIDGTSNATNIVDFVKEYGYAGSRSHTAERSHSWSLGDYSISSECLWKHGFEYKYEGSAGSTVRTSDIATLVKNRNFTDIFYHRRISGRTEHGAEISSIPYPISNHTGVISFFVSPYAYPHPGNKEWRLLIEHQKILGANYGIGGFCMGDTYETWIGNIPETNGTVNTFIDDDAVWKTNGPLFVDWWDKRWKTNMTDFSVGSTQMTIKLQTPNILGLTFLLKGITTNIREVTVDGASLSLLPKLNRLIIPELSQGTHSIVIKFGTGIFSTATLKEYNEKLKNEGKPYVLDSSHPIIHLDFVFERLSITLEAPPGAIIELEVYSPDPPSEAYADGQGISYTYDAHVTTIIASYAHIDIQYEPPEISPVIPDIFTVGGYIWAIVIFLVITGATAIYVWYRSGRY